MNDFDSWDKVFDKSKASKVPEKFPGDIINPALQLEDVLEEVTDEINEKDHSRIDNQHEQSEVTDNGQQHRTITNQEATKKASVPSVVSEKQNGDPKQVSFFKKPMLYEAAPKKVEKLEQRKGFFSIETQEKSSDWIKDNDVKEPSHAQESIGEKKPESEKNHNNIESLESLTTTIDKQTVSNDVNRNHQIEGRTYDEENNLTEDNQEVYLTDAITGKGITLEEAKNLRFLLFGDVTTTFNEDWTRVPIRLEKAGSYSMAFPKGPTEKLISFVQAYVLKHFLFDEKLSEAGISSKKDGECYKYCLVLAIVDMLWQAGMQQKAVVCLPTCSKDAFSSIDLKLDGLIERLQLYEFRKKEDLQTFIERNLKFLERERQPGCILLIYSLIMSRTVEGVNEDINSTYNCLVQQGTCSQALSNLFLTGKAAPNVFNNNKEIKNEIGKTEICHGISKRCEIGFLSYQEVENPKNITVGSMLKTPVFPIWVVFTSEKAGVLYCRKRQLLSDWKLERRFDLHYHGRMPRHLSIPHEDIRLTIDTVRPFDPEETEYEFNSELEDTIRTKWQDCVIEWNNYQRF
ncbi:inactive ubiquitin carboxyl-terminal hydrolase MINDY-4B-like [Rhopilema esculentum]|uniref:inactive ubiquitin carboxyl-terminal hydrolase MINDY-4B-like n=1 Tax=Rhopilema esculentum TaxID=499914 RepID=UPI0031DBD497